MKSKESKIYALGIVAHPDDETFLMGGTSLKLVSEGKKLAVICATKGEKGADRLGRSLSKKQMAAERIMELKKAAKIIKISNLDFFNYPDGGLDRVDFKKLVRDLIKKIQLYKPEIILTFGPEGISGHKDHIAIGNAATVAARAVPDKPKELWLASMPRSKMSTFRKMLAKRKVHHSHFSQIALNGIADKQLKIIDIKKFKKQKLKAIEAHKSQHVPSLVMDSFLNHEYFQVLKIKP